MFGHHLKVDNSCTIAPSGTSLKDSGECKSAQLADVADFIFWGSKIIADGECRHEIKRHLLHGRKAMPNLDSILKSRDITLPLKVCTVKAMVFPVVMYGCENWTINKAEDRRIDVLNCSAGEDS